MLNNQRSTFCKTDILWILEQKATPTNDNIYEEYSVIQENGNQVNVS